GSTGLPKGVLRMESETERRRHALFLSSLFDLGADDVLLVPGPLHHAGGRLFAGLTREIGATLILMRRFDAKELLELIDHHQVTSVVMVPTMLYRILKLGDEVLDSYDLSSLRSVIHMGGPCSVDL